MLLNAASNGLRRAKQKQSGGDVVIKATAEPVRVPRPSWASLFQGKQLTAKGTSLTFIAPTLSDGKPGAMLLY